MAESRNLLGELIGEAPVTQPGPLPYYKFEKIAQDAALAYSKERMKLPPSLSPNEFTYLPFDEVRARNFKPHAWIIHAMEKAHADGFAEADENADKRVQEKERMHREQIAELKMRLQKFEKVQALRREIESFSMNREETLKLLYELADL